VDEQGKQSDEQSGRTLTILTTEHYNLQSARAASISETSARTALFLSTVSSGLVALGFVAQVLRGEGLYVFGLVLFPTLLFLGLVTFERVLQSSIQDIVSARGINRIRHFYAEIDPHAASYFILSTHDDQAGTMADMGIRPSPWQSFVTLAGMVAVIDGVIAGAFAGLLVSLLEGALGLKGGAGAVTLPVVGGALVFILAVVVQQRYQEAQWRTAVGALPVLFPSPPGQTPAGPTPTNPIV